jgi:hypothetical protein
LLCKSSDDLERETTEGVRFDELVEIHVQKFGRDAKMTTEIEALREADHTVLVFGILKL